MKSFGQYLSEIFSPKRRVPVQHPHMATEWNGVHTKYMDKRHKLETSIFGIGERPESGAGEVYVSFRVDGKHRVAPQKKDRTKVLSSVFSHMQHFVKQHKPSVIYFETDNEKKDRIYRRVGSRLGVPVRNLHDDT